MSITTSLNNLYVKTFDLIDRLLMPLVLLAMRIWMARVFILSGLTKIKDWSGTVELFRDVYKTPYLAPEMAAQLTTSFELVCPVLLILGLFTRIATIPMLVMTAIIQFTFMNSLDHFYWAIMLSTILCKGGGYFSLDYALVYKSYYGVIAMAVIYGALYFQPYIELF